MCITRRPRQHPGGRRPDGAKDAAILEAARATFLERGYHATTIESIAVGAHVSKVTIYKRWADKEALFEAVMDAEIATLTGRLGKGSSDVRCFAQQLDAFGSDLLQFLFDPAHIALGRLLTFDLAHSPITARRLFDLGYGYGRIRLADMLRDAADRSTIEIDNPLLAAEDLLSLWRGMLDAELTFGILKSVDSLTIRTHVERGTRGFLTMVTGRKG